MIKFDNNYLERGQIFRLTKKPVLVGVGVGVVSNCSYVRACLQGKGEGLRFQERNNNR